MLQKAKNILDFISSDQRADVGAGIQEALVSLKDSGGTLFFPARDYCISKTIFFYSNQNLIFEEGAVLKRISTSEKNSYGKNLTCGCFLCNWFETENTKENIIACENVNIIGATFDMGSKDELTSNVLLRIGVAPINTCHAQNVSIKNCKFINNYTAHCIEINSSDDVYIENCVFSDYIGRADFDTSQSKYDEAYNEMIQIDKAVNAALGTNYGDGYSTLVGYTNSTYIATTVSETNKPDYKPCNNINISKCYFYTNVMCCAIGNHHEIASSDTIGKKYNTTVHSNIKIHNNLFEGQTAGRGHIAFDTFTTDIDIYNNTFISGTMAIRTLHSDANCRFYDNKLEQVNSSYSGDIYAYDNFVNGELTENNNFSKLNNFSLIEDTYESSLYLDGFILKDGFQWIYSGEKTSDNPKEYNNENILQFRGIGLQCLQMCFFNKNIDLTDGLWHDVGVFQEGCQLPGHSPFTFSVPTGTGKNALGLIVPKQHANNTIRNYLRIRDPSKSMPLETYFYLSQIVPCDSYEDNIQEESLFSLNENNFQYDLTTEYSNEKGHYFKNCGMQYFQLCLKIKNDLTAGNWITVGDFSENSLIGGNSNYTFCAKTMNGIDIYCAIIPTDSLLTNGLQGTLRIKPMSGTLTSSDRIYICYCQDSERVAKTYTKKENAITLKSNFGWGLQDEYSNSTILTINDTQLQKINLTVEIKEGITLKKGVWYDVGEIITEQALPGFSPFAVSAFFGNLTSALVIIIPKYHAGSSIRNYIRVKPYSDITYTSTPDHEYKNRLSISLLLPFDQKSSLNSSSSNSNNESDTNNTIITSTSAKVIELNTTIFSTLLDDEYNNLTITKLSSGVEFIQMCLYLKQDIDITSGSPWRVVGTITNQDYQMPGTSLYTSLVFDGQGVPWICAIIPSNYTKDASIKNQIRLKPLQSVAAGERYIYIGLTIPSKI